MHLKGADKIAKIFGVSRVTVVKWYKCGAPILIVGKKYQTNYYDLWNWIKDKRPELDILPRLKSEEDVKQIRPGH